MIYAYCGDELANLAKICHLADHCLIMEKEGSNEPTGLSGHEVPH